MFCQGQVLPIMEYQPLFTLLGTTYGGNGTTEFALPNLPGIKDASGATLNWIIAFEGIFPARS